jgi:hypothetical protein
MNGVCAWLTVRGLFVDIAGATDLSYGLIIRKKRALELGVPAFAYSTEEENLQLPQVKDRLKQSRNAAIGLAPLVAGFALQVGTGALARGSRHVAASH